MEITISIDVARDNARRPEPDHLHFAAMEYYFLILNRSFEIIITAEGIYGSLLGGVIYAHQPSVARASKTGNGYDLFSEQQIDRARWFSIDDADFLTSHPQNFHYQKSTIASLSYDASNKWGMGPVLHSGKLCINTLDGKKRQLIPLGTLAMPVVLSRLQQLGYAVCTHHGFVA